MENPKGRVKVEQKRKSGRVPYVLEFIWDEEDQRASANVTGACFTDLRSCKPLYELVATQKDLSLLTIELVTAAVRLELMKALAWRQSGSFELDVHEGTKTGKELDGAMMTPVGVRTTHHAKVPGRF